MKFVNIFLVAIITIMLSSCKKETSSINQIRDADGNTYNTVTIGSQIWLKENLKTSKYRNGDIIISNLSDAQWESTTVGAYAIYNNSSSNNNIYGKLYNWYAVNDSRGICPLGYHIPSDSEWGDLVTELGGGVNTGGILKSVELWLSPNTDASDSKGFHALPSGFREGLGYGGIYDYLGRGTGFWSSTEVVGTSNTAAYNHSLEYNSGSITRSYGDASNGLSCRCLKD